MNKFFREKRVVLALSVIVSVFLVVSAVSAVTTITTNINTEGTLTVGSGGTAVSKIMKGTCNLSTTVARTALSTSTLPFQCAVTGTASGDQVFVSLASDGGSITSATGLGGIRVSYAVASTAASFIEVGLSNWSGAATSSYTLATTSVQYWIVR